ncbi:MAG: PEP-utilizing enzyme [Actinomycetota bacterium]|nr:PEP-utilizing enzyme [Actinomycetota bacterium]
MHLVEAGYLEMRSLLEASAGPSREELAGRARYREEANEDQVPTVLGGAPRSPVPTEWLPPGAARTERAFRAYVGAMSGEAEEVAGEAASVRGLPASPGSYEGRARVVRSASELARVQKGDVLVTTSTTPAFSVVLPLVGAIVTDRGGLLSHPPSSPESTASRPW